MSNMVIRINNTVYLKVAKRVDLKHIHYKEKNSVTVYGDEC